MNSGPPTPTPTPSVPASQRPVESYGRTQSFVVDEGNQVMASQEGRENGGPNPTKFQELTSCEVEGNSYLDKLKAEEDELRKQLGEGREKGRSLQSRYSRYEGKIMALRETTTALGVEYLREETQQLEKELAFLQSEILQTNQEVVEHSSQGVRSILQFTKGLASKKKEIRSPSDVTNAANTREAEIISLKNNICEIQKENELIEKKKRSEGEIINAINLMEQITVESQSAIRAVERLMKLNL